MRVALTPLSLPVLLFVGLSSWVVQAKPETKVISQDSIVDVVFSLDGVLLNQVPHSFAKDAPPGKYIEVNKRTFRISDHAVRMINRLAMNPKIRISFFSGRTTEETKQILEAIKLDGSGSLSMKSVT
jgi:hypothetical protein